MKKLVLLMISVLTFLPNAYANECPPDVIKGHQELLKDVTYELSYNDLITDINGEFDEGNFNVTFKNVPEGYFIAVPSDYSVQIAENNVLVLSGGVHEIQFYTSSCDGAVKKIEIMLPFYKQYCDLNKDCKNEDVWFDGTYENKLDNYVDIVKDKLSTELLVVLISLIVIIVICILIIFIVRKRSKL